jgi:hypothetical protein
MMEIPEKIELSTEKIEEFLKALTVLTHTMGIQVAGCGCCGSPFLMGVKAEPDKRYVCDNEGYDLDFQ